MKEKKSNTEQLDFLGVGDLVIDTFIELIDAWIEDDNPEKKEELCMRFGDKIPYKKEVTVPATGNSMNAAHAAKKLGLKVGVMTDVGDNEQGHESIKYLKEKGINTSFVSVHPDHETNHNFILRFKAERTILVHHNEYSYSLPKQFSYSNFKGPKWMYLSSLAHNSLPHHDRIASFLEAHPETKLAFQPGTFQIKLGAEKLTRLYKLAEIFFCNKEEAQKILNNKSNDIKELLNGMADLGPKIVVITDGPDGAYVLDTRESSKRSGESPIYHGPMYPDPAPPVDRTGAGDSFSATFTVALAKDKTIEDALMWGPINSMSVVQKIGAQAGHITEKELDKYLKNAPENYKVEKIN